METTVKNTLDNENGMIMVVVLIILVIVTILGLSASQTSVTEVQIATNERRLVNDFYLTERVLISTLEGFNVWLSPFVAAVAANGETNVAVINPAVDYDGDGNPDAMVDVDGDGNPDARVEIRCIEATGDAVAGGVLSNAADNVPMLDHSSSPPEGSTPESTYSLNYKIHRYAVTVTSAAGNTQVQAGVWKIFNGD